MDVNGTQFHLLYNEDDWGQCFLEGDEQPLRIVWREGEDAANIVWDGECHYLRLRRLSTRFQQARRFSDRLRQSRRRGADRDQYGNWYMIDSTRKRILFQGYYAREFIIFWDSQVNPDDDLPHGVFQPKPTAPRAIQLYGLTITTEHYLVVGWRDDAPDGESGLLIFDLHQGNRPFWMVWEPEVQPDALEDFDPCGESDDDTEENDLTWDCVDKDANFLPKDMAPLPDGGLVILDQARFWVLNRNFQVLTKRPIGPDSAGSSDGGETPISIETTPEGEVLILLEGGVVMVYWLGEDDVPPRIELWAKVPLAESETGKEVRIEGHDFVYVPEEKRLYVGEVNGNQLVAFDFDLETVGNKVLARADFIPLRRWQGRGLIYDGETVYYDFGDRWVSIQTFTSQDFVQRAVLLTPFEIAPQESFDSGLLGCVWHRLMLDAVIPEGSRVIFRARAADEIELLPVTAWQDQPEPYRRHIGAEIPYYRHPHLPDGEYAGTWELLFQEVRGRYLQLEITIEGTGRSTPKIYAVRVWFPRFSYLEKYLPEIYRRDPLDASYLERWLANFEGVFTNIEDHIEQFPRMLDPRSAPTDILNWLSDWLGLVLDPVWNEQQRRFFIRHAHEFYKWRGTLRGLEMMLRLYLDPDIRSGRAAPEVVLEDPTGYRHYIRLEESFIRQRFILVDDPTDDDEGDDREQYETDIPGSAHRFIVLIPADLEEDEATMIGRIINLEKPAHTLVSYQLYGDRFRVGSALIGSDTLLDIPSEVREILLGTTRLPDGYLSPGYPANVTDRVVTDRDSLGDMPAL